MSVDPAQRFPELDTPSLVIHLDAMERNIAEMAQVARAAGVHLRPHTKTHKCPEIAAMQIAAGARGITVAKLGEAEVMADAGIDDILIAYPIVGEAKLRRLRAVMERAHPRVTGLGRGGRGHRTAGHGTRRTRRGVRGGRHGPAPHGRPLGEPTVELVVEVARVPGVEVVGLLTHEGQAYAATPQDMEPLVARMGIDLVDTAERCAAAGVPIREISVGSTPTARIAAGADGITEIRPGTYVFNDVQQMRVGVATEPTCAARVLATVVARPWQDRFVIDAGSKSLTSDGSDGPPFPGRGVVAGRPDLRLDFLTEEHGVGHIEPGGTPLAIGDRLEIIPLHVCSAVNMFDVAYGVRDGAVDHQIQIAGRGKVQ